MSKPFPWGTALGSLLLGALLIGVIAYAALNQGSGISGVISDPDNNIKGLVVADDKNLPRNHVPGSVDYPELPPVGGDHNATPQQCAVYSAAIAPEHALHSLEHGAVWITYDPVAAADQVTALAAVVGSDPYLMMSPLPGQDSSIILSAWGRQLAVDDAGDSRIGQFINAYKRTGPQTPEPGASCSGTTSTGPVQQAAPEPAVQPSEAATPAPPVAPGPQVPSPAVPDPAVPSPATS